MQYHVTQNWVNGSECMACPASTTSSVDSISISSCKCNPNSQSIPGSSSCKCNSGFYGGGQNTCLQCPLNTGSSEGSSLLSDCLCNAGFSGTSDNCEACLKGKFKETGGEMACSPCPEDHYSPASSTLASACYAAPKVVFSFAMAGTVPCMMYSLRFLYFEGTIQLTRNE